MDTDAQPTIIIGGGLAGITSFYHVLADGKPAILLDAQPHAAHGASFANGGVLHPSLPDPWNNPGIGAHLLASLVNRQAAMRLGIGQIPKLLGWGYAFLKNSNAARHRAISRANYALAAYSAGATDALRQRLNLHYDAAAPGTLKLLRSPAAQATSLALADILAADGLAYQHLSRQQVCAREPALAEAAALRGALYFADDRIGDARKFCLALLAEAHRLGGQSYFNTRVTRLLTDKGRVVGVRTGDRDIRGPVVVCAGTGAAALTAPLGVDLPIQPAKGYSITVPASGAIRLAHALVDPHLHIGVTPLGDRVRILGMAEFVGDDARLQAHRLAILRRFFDQLMPTLSSELDWQQAENWCGLRPMSSDGRPFIGNTGIDGLSVNCGHGHLGWTMAVGSARLLVDILAGRRPEIDPAPFAVGPSRRIDDYFTANN